MVTTKTAPQTPLTLALDGSEPLTAATVKAVTVLCDQAEDAADGIVTVRVTGAPDLTWTSGVDVILVTKWERVLRRLERLPRATVAVASGDCGGTALDAFLAADIRMALPDTRLLVPRDATATWPGMAGYRLVQLAGAARTRKAVLFGHPIAAAEALDLGIVDEIAEDPAAALAAAAEVTRGVSGQELAIRRQLLFDATTTSFEDALGAHLAACDRALRQSTGRTVEAS
ncbi:enoyl-CoA-hydratase DpgB [Streptomyces sp. S.PNR 29]|uniref:enoyl-CoA-hydratase DpgB n=1 Tax=Streptomyces sp. S.PNR 29 TaxID=2973805 RepID=UPI0025B02DE4|nr:enoyl-CoA-hydratase DpgB [Streptomyces sp. S.PNR 29]MDN0200195.1 enoyl-CoA hydratase/isomerase family protein [Streptomyces sp. S.PNR 29]